MLFTVNCDEVFREKIRGVLLKKFTTKSRAARVITKLRITITVVFYSTISSHFLKHIFGAIGNSGEIYLANNMITKLPKLAKKRRYEILISFRTVQRLTIRKIKTIYDSVIMRT